MSNIYFPNETIQIYRRRRISSTDRYSLSATFTAYQSDIQPASQERTQFIQGRIGATFTAFIEAYVDIKEGDQIRTDDGKVYSVKSVMKWQNAGLLDYIELIITSQDA